MPVSLDCFDPQRDDPRMALALEWGRRAQVLCPPNPAVGCTMWLGDQLIGAGHTQQTGGPHAEVMAMRAVQASGWRTQGATAYVTLEPCSHYGRTPPCALALVEAGVARVVVAVLDPNPQVAGRGVQILRDAGVQVDVLPPDHPLAHEAWLDNIGFFSRMKRQCPWVRMKIAGSLDGRTALDNGDSQWITGATAREDGQHWRARAGAVLTGIGTVLDDDPRLDVRALDTPRQPLRVVLDSNWRMPPQSRMVQPPGQTLVYGLDQPGSESARQALVAQGAQVRVLPSDASGLRLDLGAVMADLAQMGINEVHVEAGARLNGALISGDWVDEFLLYLAPKLIGPGRGLAALSPLGRVADALTLQFKDVQLVGEDLRVIARQSGRDRF